MKLGTGQCLFWLTVRPLPVEWKLCDIPLSMLDRGNKVNGSPEGDANSAMSNETSAPEVLEQLVQRAEAAGASDVHLHMVDGAARMSFRLDGVMTPGSGIPPEVAARVFGRIKFLAKLKTYQESIPQDGRIDRQDIGARSDIRVATYPTVTGEKMVLRLFAGPNVMPLDQLGFPASVRDELERFLTGSSGLLLLTGPAGSGKTTTIYACLQHLAGLGGRHIISVEDPVEQVVAGIMQTEVNEAAGLTFARAARHLLRQDPQVLVIGEIRDDETARIATRAAFTGHLVISTLHAGSCRGVFERLLVMSDDRYSALSAVQMVINQRLIRKLCDRCRGEGCDGCLGTGYRGRVPLVEWLKADDDFRRRVANEGAGAIEPHAPIRRAAEDMIEAGTTNRAEVERVFGR